MKRCQRTDRVNLIVEPFDPNGLRHIRRIHIEDPAAEGKLTRHLDRGGGVIAALQQPLSQGFEVGNFSDFDQTTIRFICSGLGTGCMRAGKVVTMIGGSA